LFRTFTPSNRAYGVVYGLDDADPVKSASFPGLLAMPFEAEDVRTRDRRIATSVAAP
jgi:hypothetical protein